LADAHSLKGGPDVSISRSQRLWADHLALATTAVMVARRSPVAEVTATITRTLLCCDAWFDVLTSRGSSDIAQAAASALIIELPLAALCFWMAHNLAHAVEVARPYLQRAGFTIANNTLVPPHQQTEQHPTRP